MSSTGRTRPHQDVAPQQPPASGAFEPGGGGFQRLVERAPAVMFQFRLAPDGRVSVPYIGRNIFDLVGVTAERIMADGAELMTRVHPEDEEAFAAAIRTSAATLTPFRAQARAITAHGLERWFEARSTPEAQDDGSILWDGVMTDVTERVGVEQSLRRAEVRARESEETYRQLFELESDAIFLIDNTSGRILQANRAASELYGYPQAELLRLRNVDLSAEQEQTRTVTVATPNDPDRLVSIPLRWHRKKDGTRFPVEITGRFFTHQGRAVHIAAMRDITARQQAEEKQRRQAFFFEQLFAQSSVSTQLLDREGWCERINPKLSELFGVTPEQMEGRAYNIFQDEGIRQGGVLPYLERVFEHGENAEWEVHFDIGVAAESQNIAVAEKKKVWFRNWAYPIFDDRGQVSHVVIQHVDISDRKREEQERERLQAQFLQSQKMESIGRLAGGVAHDFNNMLSVILGHTEMALGTLDPKTPLHTDLQEIRHAAQRSAELTRQLLAFARLQAVAPGRLDLNSATASALSLLRRLIGENIALHWDPGETLWPVILDAAQLDQILANLAVNARDAIAGVGKVTLKTRNCVFDRTFCDRRPAFQPGDYVLLSFSDDGSGMDDETMARVFEPFFTTKDVGRGTGLGLATVYGIVQQNGGFLNVLSAPGQGSTFEIYLPRAAGSATPVRSELPQELPRGAGETILLLEDEEAILSVGKAMLEKVGYQVLTARSPGEAIGLVAGHTGPIDLLLVDVIMPEMNGRQAATRLAELRPGLRCLYMSGYTADVIADHGVLEAGVKFLQKPFTMRGLAVAVCEALQPPEDPAPKP